MKSTSGDGKWWVAVAVPVTVLFVSLFSLQSAGDAPEIPPLQVDSRSVTTCGLSLPSLCTVNTNSPSLGVVSMDPGGGIAIQGLSLGPITSGGGAGPGWRNYGGYFGAIGDYGWGVYGGADGWLGRGVCGAATGDHGYGVSGIATGDYGIGVGAQTYGKDGRGVYGIAHGEASVGVEGIAQGTNSMAGWFRACGEDGIGVKGTGGAAGMGGDFSGGSFGTRGIGSGTGFGGVFFGSEETHDLVLGGAIGAVNSDPESSGSSLELISNSCVKLYLDNDELDSPNGLFLVYGAKSAAAPPLLRVGTDGLTEVRGLVVHGLPSQADLMLGGGVGVLSSCTTLADSALRLSSNSNVSIQLDADGAGSLGGGVFSVSDADGVSLLRLHALGDSSIESMSNLYFRLNRGGTYDHYSLTVRDHDGNELLVVDETATTTTGVLKLTGGLDVSEDFLILEHSAGGEAIPGMVVCIDQGGTGALCPCATAYDRTVAGVISGAGSIQAGLTLSGADVEGTQRPVALVGRVYCWADASNGPIEPGDLLTTSSTPGHAMRVTDYSRATGAVLGKAMSDLPEGKGLILVLVNLQ